MCTSLAVFPKVVKDAHIDGSSSDQLLVQFDGNLYLTAAKYEPVLATGVGSKVLYAASI